MPSNFLDVKTMKVLGQRGKKTPKHKKLPIMWRIEEENIEKGFLGGVREGSSTLLSWHLIDFIFNVDLNITQH